jgi:stage II sporulation protein AA (anti-sigma F factor antagonist)
VLARLSGELDHHGAAEIRAKLNALIADHTVSELVLDMGNVTFMDSAGLGVILGRYRDLSRRGGRLILTCVPGDIDRLFEMYGMYSLAGCGRGMLDATDTI